MVVNLLELLVSGSGKSTLTKLLPRLYDVDSGRILIDDYDVSKVNFQVSADKSELFLKNHFFLKDRSLKILHLTIHRHPLMRLSMLPKLRAHDFISFGQWICNAIG